MKVTNAAEAPLYPIQHKNAAAASQVVCHSHEKRFDRFRPAADKSQPAEQAQTAEQVADALRKQYPWVTFTFAQLGEQPQDIAQFAAFSESGVHLVMAPDVLEWMAQDKRSWADGLEMIGKALHDLMLHPNKEEHSKGAVIQENGEITLWSATWKKPNSKLEKDFEAMQERLEQIDQARKEKAEQLKKMKLEQKKKLNYQMSRDMARLAKGATGSDVRSLISSMYANRQRIASNSSYSKKEIQLALAQMDYVIGRARAKIRHLKDEEDMQLRIKKAEQQKEEKRRLQLEQELKNRRRNRITRERAAIYEKMPDLPGLRSEEERHAASAEAMVSGMASGAVSGQGVPAGSFPASTSAASSNVTVSMPSGGAVQVSICPMA